MASALDERSATTDGRARVGMLSAIPLGVYLLAALKLLLTVAFSTRYGFHRDELYYLACARHPALGYVDFPPITPMLARLDVFLFGTGLVTLRLFPRTGRERDRRTGSVDRS